MGQLNIWQTPSAINMVEHRAWTSGSVVNTRGMNPRKVMIVTHHMMPIATAKRKAMRLATCAPRAALAPEKGTS